MIVFFHGQAAILVVFCICFLFKLFWGRGYTSQQLFPRCTQYTNKLSYWLKQAVDICFQWMTRIQLFGLCFFFSIRVAKSTYRVEHHCLNFLSFFTTTVITQLHVRVDILLTSVKPCMAASFHYAPSNQFNPVTFVFNELQIASQGSQRPCIMCQGYRFSSVSTISGQILEQFRQFCIFGNCFFVIIITILS